MKSLTYFAVKEVIHRLGNEEIKELQALLKEILQQNHERAQKNLEEAVRETIPGNYNHPERDWRVKWNNFLDEIIIDPFRRHVVESQVQEAKPTSAALPLDLREFQQQQEKDFLQTSLLLAKFNQKKAAELLGLTYHQLRALLKKHQI